MKTNHLFVFCIAAAIISLAGCEKAPESDPVNPNPDEQGPEVPDTPTFSNGVYIYEDGSVLVESDNGYETVNGLKNAIDSYAGVDVVTSETGKTVPSSNRFYLQRGGHYYVEGLWVITKDVTVLAEDGDGNMPVIQSIADETGARNSDMIRLEANVRFENIYFLGQDAMTGAHQQRMLRIDGQNCRLTLESCFGDYCRNFFIRMDNTGSKVYLKNSTFRNMAYNCSSNGRLVDTRGNGADTVSIVNCIVYNNVGPITRFDGSVINHLEWISNTFYNCGFVPVVEHPKSILIENNIFANVGWHDGANAIGTDETGATEIDSAFWDIDFGETEDVSGAEVIIRNNNIFNTAELKALYAKYPETAMEPEGLSACGQQLLESGNLVYTDNISEVLEFDNPAPIYYDFIDLYLSDVDTPDEEFADLPWFVDEDGVTGIIPGKIYTFGYSESSKSATASTTGGKLGASR